VNGFVGVAAEVRDVRMVMEALRMAVDWEVVDCEDGTADARVVMWETMLSTAFDLPEAGTPLSSLAYIFIVTVICVYLTTMTCTSARRRACSHTRFASSRTPGPCSSVTPSSESGRVKRMRDELWSQMAASPFLYARLRAVRRMAVEGPLGPAAAVGLRYETRREFRGDVIEGVPIIVVVEKQSQSRQTLFHTQIEADEDRSPERVQKEGI